MSHQARFRLSGLAIGTLSATLAASSAYSAAIERAIPSTTRILFEEGRYIEFGVTYVDPDQSGDDATLPTTLTGLPVALPFTGGTGDLFEEHWNFSGAYKADINDRLSYALIFDQPYGADTYYGSNPMTGPTPPGFDYGGTSADLTTYQLTGLLSYDATENVKVYGGLRAQQLKADASIPFVSNFEIDADADWGYGYMLGAAYHRPEIALRVALTYYSKIEHSLDTEESTTALGVDDTETNVDTPQSVELEFQTGVAENTLIFGSIRWVDWSEFSIAPPNYITVTNGRPLVDYADDWWTYTAGVAQRFNEKLAGSLSVVYEPDVGGELTTLGPYDGRTMVRAGLSYDVDENLNLSGGLTYGKIGDTFNVLQTDFNDGSIWGAGLRIGYSF